MFTNYQWHRFGLSSFILGEKGNILIFVFKLLLWTDVIKAGHVCMFGILTAEINNISVF